MQHYILLTQCNVLFVVLLLDPLVDALFCVRQGGCASVLSDIPIRSSRGHSPQLRARLISIEGT